MELFAAALLALVQDDKIDALVKQMRVIEERDIFFPAKAKARPRVRRGPSPRPVERKADPPALVITGFAAFPDGFRVLIHDPAGRSGGYYKIGDKVDGTEIIAIDPRTVVVRNGNGPQTLRVGDVWPGSKRPPSEGGTSDRDKGPAEKDSKETRPSRSRMDEIRKRLRDRYGKKPKKD